MKTNKTKLIAVCALAETGVGFDWGERARYALRPATREGARQILDDLCYDVNEETIAALMAGEVPYGTSWDVAIVDASVGITTDWPTAGNGNEWEDDPYQGVADAIGYYAYQRLGAEYGVPTAPYPWPDWTRCAWLARDGENVARYIARYDSAAADALRRAMEAAKEAAK